MLSPSTNAVPPDHGQLSRSAMVCLGMGGVHLPKGAGQEVTRLDRAGLALLLRLAAAPADARAAAADVAAAEGADPATLDRLVDELVARSLLVPSTESLPPTDDAPAGDDVPPLDDAVQYVLPVPTVLRITPQGFEWLTHDGRCAHRFSTAELVAAATWRTPSTVAAAHQAHREGDAGSGLDDAAFDRLAAALRRAGILEVFDPERPQNGTHGAAVDELRDSVGRKMRIMHRLNLEVAAQEAAEGDRARTPVVPIHSNWVSPPFSLGLVVAYAKAYKGGLLERDYRFVPRWLIDPGQVDEVAARPSIFLFSNYIWNHDVDRQYASRIKARSPHSVTIHGGPDTPKYDADLEAYFRDNPAVDVTIRGEGEATLAEALEALAGQVGEGKVPDLSVLADVPGLAFRSGDGVVRTGERDRIEDLDTIPSPFLTGLFDSYAAGPARAAVLETNRGCPYGCTFCDWGSATLSRIRKFDLDRVFAELEWCARNEFQNISLADANFGIFERDVEIAEKIAELKQTYGYPFVVGNNYAKNTVKHLKKIIKVMADAGIITEGIVSLQSMDTDTLRVIRRKNIKVEKYNDLAAEFHANHLPLAVDLMMALPGSTVASFRNDLQECINRDVRTRVHPTTLLPNSPMNDPDYRRDNGIVAKPGEVVKQSTTFTEDDWDHMYRLRGVFLLCDIYSVLRYVSRYVRRETGTREVDFYERLMVDALADPERFPVTAFVVRHGPDLMVPPASWALFVDEVGRYLVDVLGIADDAALATVLTVQRAHLPARDRTFPVTLELAHDYVAWHRQWLAACDSGHREDWEAIVDPLRSLPPSTLTIDDPDDVCRTAMGGDVTNFGIRLLAWDFGSPVARPRVIDHAAAKRAAEEAAAVERGPSPSVASTASPAASAAG